MAGAETGATIADGSRAGRDRDAFLDLLRAFATLRVAAWHAFGAPWLTVVSAIPVMFFVSGDLFARSARTRRPWTVVRSRLRRLLLPFWAFALFAWGATLIASRTTDVARQSWRALAWIVPLVDPSSLGWDHGWLSSPLWYVRAYLWVLLAAPVLLWLVRRAGGAVTFVGGAAAVLAIDVLGRQRWAYVTALPTLWWKVGDLALYGTFFAAGAAAAGRTARGLPEPRRSRLLAVAACTAVVAGAWALVRPAPLGVVNNSHPLHLFVGTATLAALLGARPLVATAAGLRPVRPVVALLRERALTVYLWHSTAIAATIVLLDRRDIREPVVRAAVFVTSAAAATVLLVAFAGWVEDLAARRPLAGWPVAARTHRRTRAGARTFVAAAAVVTVVAGSAARRSPDPATAASITRYRPPSQQPPPPTFERTLEPAGAPAAPASPKTARLDRDHLRAHVEAWSRREGIGVAAAVLTGGGELWVTATGERPDDGRRVRADDRFPIDSATKLFTGWLVFQAADAGQLALDRPLPRLDAVPDFPYGQITPRQLLAHRSGLVNYADTPAYDPSAPITVAGAIRASAAEPLLFTPGTRSLYSSVNYLLLGVLLEQVTGRTYDDLLDAALVRPLGLRSVRHLPSGPGAPNGGASGLVMDVADLARAGAAVLREGRSLRPEARAAMLVTDAVTGVGTGTMAFCPCTIDQGGHRSFSSHGYYGRETLVAYDRSADRVVVVQLTASLWEDNRFDRAVELLHELTR